MNKPFIKICGIINIKDAALATSLNVNSLGFNMYEKSARYIPKEKVQEIIGELPENTIPVMVFVDPTFDYVRSCLDISSKIIRVEKLLAGSLAIRKNVREDARKAREKAGNKAQEAALEKSKDPDAKKGPKLNLPGKGILAKIFGFFGTVILGWIAVRIIDWLPKLMPVLKILGQAVDGIIWGAGKILDGLTWFID